MDLAERVNANPKWAQPLFLGVEKGEKGEKGPKLFAPVVALVVAHS
jgi:hypothetical protein